MSGAGEGTQSVAGQRNPSGRKGSGGGEEWGCAGGGEEMETCMDRGRLLISIYCLNNTVRGDTITK